MKLILFLFFIFAIDISFAQQKEINKKERALEGLREEIESYEKKIQESEKKEILTLERIDDIEKQSNTVNRLVTALTSEAERIHTQIIFLQKTIIELESQLSAIVSQYARYAKSVYTKGKIHDLETIASANSLNQIGIRVVYLKYFSEQRKKDISLIQNKSALLADEKSKLEVALIEEKNLISQKSNEFDNLVKMKSRRKILLSEIRNNQKEYERELLRKIKASKDLEKIIVDLIEDERVRKEEEEKKKIAQQIAKNKKLKTAKPIVKSYPILPLPEKNKLPWPVVKGTIVTRFGISTHPILKIQTENNGIDISVPSGSDVKAVSDAEVSIIYWLPSYGNLIILNHRNGLRTVYANLSDIFVTKGQSVKKGSLIARSGETISGSILHFEVWREKEKLNPENWLTKKR